MENNDKESIETTNGDCCYSTFRCSNADRVDLDAVFGDFAGGINGAFGQIFPKAAEAATYDVNQLTLFQRIIIFAGTMGELVLPVLIVIGLMTRLAALGMIGVVLVQTVVDVTGHGAKLGGYFDKSIALLDERTFWVFLLIVLVFKGAGPLSLDRFFVRSET